MTLEQIRDYCLSLPGVTEDIKWEEHLCFSVGGKLFLITAPDEVPVTAAFKTSDELFDVLSQRDNFVPAPHMARNKWIKTGDIGSMGQAEWKKLLHLSYTLIFSKLTLKMQKEITEGKTSGTASIKSKKKK